MWRREIQLYTTDDDGNHILKIPKSLLGIVPAQNSITHLDYQSSLQVTVKKGKQKGRTDSWGTADVASG